MDRTLQLNILLATDRISLDFLSTLQYNTLLAADNILLDFLSILQYNTLLAAENILLAFLNTIQHHTMPVLLTSTAQMDKARSPTINMDRVW
jgi:hypothetical protein